MATNDDPVRMADESLDCLAAGSARFVRGQASFPAVQKEILLELAKEQQR